MGKHAKRQEGRQVGKLVVSRWSESCVTSIFVVGSE